MTNCVELAGTVRGLDRHGPERHSVARHGSEPGGGLASRFDIDREAQLGLLVLHPEQHPVGGLGLA